MTLYAADTRAFRSMIIFLGGFLFLAIQPALSAQDSSLDELPGLRERAVVMRIVSRIVEENQQVVWNSENSKVTIPGRPVSMKLVGANLVVVVQFTPFLRQSGQNILVAQAQIWINIPDQGISYHTTMQTIPLQFGEQVYFFPLGSVEAGNEAEAGKDEARIEIQLVLEPYVGPVPGNRHGRGSSSETRQRSESGSVPLPVPDAGASTDTPAPDTPSANAPAAGAPTNAPAVNAPANAENNAGDDTTTP